MDSTLQAAILDAARNEPMGRTLGIRVLHVDDGYAAVEMDYRPDAMNNLFGTAHGGALFALLDDAFQLAAQTVGSVSVALNVNITYLAAPEQGSTIRGEAKEISATRKTATYELRATGSDGTLLAVCQAVAYRTGKPLPFLPPDRTPDPTSSG
ncbi:MAG: PaaI family thioesterase [Deltaproteobacteria bacterium]|jgi:acyl-CoA thioesterase|nr:PaaI family thioesterase [Deltaproteobacteria bacterium]